MPIHLHAPCTPLNIFNILGCPSLILVAEHISPHSQFCRGFGMPCWGVVIMCSHQHSSPNSQPTSFILDSNVPTIIMHSSLVIIHFVSYTLSWVSNECGKLVRMLLNFYTIELMPPIDFIGNGPPWLYSLKILFND